MKKIIVFMIYTVLLFGTYYTNYSEAYSESQSELISNAIESNDKDFFAMFNQYYNEIYYNNTTGELNVYEAVNNDYSSYTFLLTNIGMNNLKDEDSSYDYCDFIISNNNKKYTFELYTGYYYNTPMYMMQISYDDLQKQIGDNITNISLVNQEDTTVFSYDVNITLQEELDITNFKVGYTETQLDEMYTFDNIGSVYIALLKYHGIVAVVIGIYFIVYIINKKKNFI